MTFKHNSQKKVSFALGAVLGVAVIMMLWLITSAVITSMILNETIRDDRLVWIIPIVQGVNTFIGAYIAGVLVYNKKNIVSIICGAAYIVVIICFNLLFLEGLNNKCWLIVLFVITGSVVAFLVHSRKNKPIHSRKRIRKGI